MKKALCLSLLILTGCGGSNETTESAEPPKAANNPLAAEQELIRQAEGMQALLDQNAADKKKQMPE